MKNLFLNLLFGVMFTAIAIQTSSAQEAVKDSKAIECLLEFSERFRTCPDGYLSYTLSTGSNPENQTRVYFENFAADTILGMRFYADGEQTRTVYNGNELFSIGLKNSERYLKKNEYDYVDVDVPFPVIQGYGYSPASLARVIPAIIADKSISVELEPDANVDGSDCHRIVVAMSGKCIYGDILFSMPGSEKYILSICKATGRLIKMEMVSRPTTFSYRYEQTEVAPADFPWRVADYPGVTEYIYEEVEELEIGDAMPEFTGELVGGGQLSRSDLKGKPCLVYFWNIGCGPCRLSTPIINRISENRPQLQVVGINDVDKDAAEVKKYLDSKGVKYPNVLCSMQVVQNFGVDGYPTFLLFDSDGNLAFTDSGYGPDCTESNLNEAVEKLLSGK